MCSGACAERAGVLPKPEPKTSAWPLPIAVPDAYASADGVRRKEQVAYLAPGHVISAAPGSISFSLSPSTKTVKCIVCAICSGPLTHANPYAVFCSSGCADRAASVYTHADAALRFLCGLNLQDHSVKEQRELLAVMRKLMAVLRPEGAGK